MIDLDRRFRSLDTLDLPDVRAEIARRASAPAPPEPGRSLSSRVVAAIVALLVFATAIALGVRALRDSPVGEPTPASDVWGDLPAGLSRLEPPPALRVTRPVWTGRELVVWGGNLGAGEPPHFNEGWAFDVASRAWRAIAPAPLSPRSWSAAVWSGREVLVWGGGAGWGPDDRPADDGAAYDPGADAWRMLPPSPLPPERVFGAIWTDEEMVVVGNAGIAAYDPEANAWRSFGPPPMAFDDADVVWTGQQVILYGKPMGTDGGRGPWVADGVALDPSTGLWSPLPAVDLPEWRGFPGSMGIDAAARTLVWDGSRLIAIDYGLRVASLDPAGGAWSSLPPLPLHASECSPSASASSGLVIVDLCGEIATLDGDAQRWRVVSAPRETLGRFVTAAPLAAGSVFLLYGSEYHPTSRSEDPVLFAYRPPERDDAVTDRDAWDIAAAFASLRSGYPYDDDIVAPEVQSNIEQLLAPSAMDAYEQHDARGLHRLWSYYWGFEVLRVEGTSVPYTVVIRFEGNETFDERLTIGPGTSIDGVARNLVILSVEPVG
jgi:hypothetical protein